MGSPTNLSDRGSGEMSAAARMHGEGLARLNALTRWYILTGVVILTLLPLFYLLDRFLPAFTPDAGIYSLVLGGAVLLGTGGIGIKFLPSSLGGNPHVYSLSMALWSYWFILIGVIGSFGSVFLNRFVSRVTVQLYSGGLAFVYFAGSGLLLYNLWKTMQNRV